MEDEVSTGKGAKIPLRAKALMAVVAVLSAFMSSTGAVAIFIPVVLGLAAKTRISPSRLMMPMATALEQTGGVDLIVNALTNSLGPMGPTAVMVGIFILSSLFSQFISNTATTVLVAPIAMSAAEGMGISPYPFLMTVAIAASTAFSTPVASPVNTLVLGPGGYRFADFIKMGVPLQLMIMILVLLVVGLVFPL